MKAPDSWPSAPAIKKLGYWDWKTNVEIWLGRSITSIEETELLWYLYDEGITPCEAAKWIRHASRRSVVITTGYNKTVRAEYIYKPEDLEI